MGQMMGWRAIIALVVIVGVSVLGFMNRSKRTVNEGTWTIEPEHMMIYELTSSGSAKMRAEFTPDGDGPYAVYVLDHMNGMKLQLPTTDADTLDKMASIDGTGPLKLPDTRLSSGTYYVVAENRGTQSLTLKYAVYELH